MHVVVIENDAKVKTSDLNSLSLNLIFNIYLKRERERGGDDAKVGCCVGVREKLETIIMML